MTTTSLFSTIKLAVLALALFVIYGVSAVHAQIPTGLELDGYAWSENIGWISLNCRTGGADGLSICPGSHTSVLSTTSVDYKVEITPRGNMTGYAWSSNIGWIKFYGLSGFPTGANTYEGSASVTGTYPNLSLRGWARACSGTNSNPNYCGNMNNNPEAGGWDGWISLRGSTANSTWGISTQNFGTAKYAWGSEVVGWIDMSTRVSLSSPTTLTGTGCTITTAGENTCSGTLTWSISPDVSNRHIVRITPLPQTIISTTITQTNKSTQLSLGNNTFAVRSGVNGSNITTKSVSAVCGTGLQNTSGTCQLIPPPPVTITSLTANPSIVRRGGTAKINWQVSPSPIVGQCTLSGPGFNNVDATLTNYTTPPLNATSIITLNCGASVKDVTITVVPAFNEI